MGDLAWMADVTEPSRKEVAAPMTLDAEGAPHAVATNGHVLVAVRGEHGFPAATTKQATMIGSVLVPPQAAPVTVSLPALKEFLGIAAEPEAPCATCGDAGRVECKACDGEGGSECECFDCGDVHDRPCRACDGVGDKRCPECRGVRGQIDPVRVGDVVFNRKTLAPVLRHLGGETATFAHDCNVTADVFRACWLRGDGWFVLAMPLRDQTKPNIPAFPLTPAAVEA